MNKIKNILSAVVLLLSVTVSAQDFSLYNLRTMPQNLQLNPGFYPQSSYYVGGGILPLPLIPQINLQVSNGFAFSDVIQGGENGTSLDLSNYINSMPDAQSLAFRTQLDLLNIGFTVKKKHFFWLNYQERIETQVLYSKQLLDFVWNFNGSDNFLGQTVRVGNFGADVKHYSAMKLGWSMKFNDQLTFGATPTVYFGKGYVSSKNSYLDIYTAADFDTLSITPYLEVESAGFNALMDSTQDFDAAGYAMNFGNMGFGIDLGAKYKINDQIEVSASIIDLGFINWKSDAKIYKNAANPIVFTGLDPTSLLGGGNGDSTSSEGESGGFVDSLMTDIQDNITPTDSTVAVRSGVPTKIFIGGAFNLNEKVQFGLLTRHTFNNGNYDFALSANANVDLSNRLSAVVSYNIMNRSYNNVGVGTAVNMGPIQFYVMMDNVLGLSQLDYTKNLDVRFGFNIRPSHHRQVKGKGKSAKSGAKVKKKEKTKAPKEEKGKEEKKPKGKAIDNPDVDKK